MSLYHPNSIYFLWPRIASIVMSWHEPDGGSDFFELCCSNFIIWGPAYMDTHCLIILFRSASACFLQNLTLGKPISSLFHWEIQWYNIRDNWPSTTLMPSPGMFFISDPAYERNRLDYSLVSLLPKTYISSPSIPLAFDLYLIFWGIVFLTSLHNMIACW